MNEAKQLDIAMKSKTNIQTRPLRCGAGIRAQGSGLPFRSQGQEQEGPGSDPSFGHELMHWAL